MYKITVVGTGYVGLANAVLLAQNNQVTALDISAEKIEMLNKRISPIQDAEIQEYLSHKELYFKATLDKQTAYKKRPIILLSRRRQTITKKKTGLIAVQLKTLLPIFYLLILMH